MIEGTYFRLDPSRIVHETIDGETIAIDLTSGTYFSLTGSGPAIWAALVAGASQETVVSAVSEVQPDDAEAAAGFIAELIGEGLLQTAETPPSGAEPAPELPAAIDAPRLERYADMEHLLLLDPIHEVQAAGWPETAPTAPEPSAG